MTLVLWRALSTVKGILCGKAKSSSPVQQQQERQSEGSTPSNGDPAEQHQIAIAIASLERRYDAGETQRSEHDRETLKWGRRAARASIFYTGFTALLLAAGIYSAFQAWRAVAAANRA